MAINIEAGEDAYGVVGHRVYIQHGDQAGSSGIVGMVAAAGFWVLSREGVPILAVPPLSCRVIVDTKRFQVNCKISESTKDLLCRIIDKKSHTDGKKAVPCLSYTATHCSEIHEGLGKALKENNKKHTEEDLELVKP